MDDYFAVGTPVGSTRPMKVTFKAANVIFALAEMLKAFKVKDTSELSSFEMNLVKPDGSYETKAERLPSESKPRVKLPAKVPPQTIVAQDTGEREYSGYQIEEA